MNERAGERKCMRRRKMRKRKEKEKKSREREVVCTLIAPGVAECGVKNAAAPAEEGPARGGVRGCRIHR
jgi:hypothetical protein